MDREIIWTVGLPHQPGVPHFQVKRPLNYWHSDLKVARGRGTSPKYLFANVPPQQGHNLWTHNEERDKYPI